MNSMCNLFLQIVICFGLMVATGWGFPVENAPASGDSQAAALHQAVENGDLTAVQNLVASGAPLDEAIGTYHYTSLIDAACSDHVEVLNYLIGRGAKLDLVDFQGSTALLHACSDNSTENAVALINAGANPNLGSHFGRFPLMYAAENGNDAIVAALLAHKADPNANCNQGSAIYWAANGNHLSTLNLLIEAGADLHLMVKGPLDPIKFQSTVLGCAAYANNVDMVDSILAHGVDANFAAINGDTALINAVEDSCIAAAEELIAKGASVDAQNKKGRTALMVAAMNSNHLMIQTLMDHHAKLDLKDADGKTALMLACGLERNDLATQLINAGADIDVTDNQGETALTIAADIGELDMVNLLKSKGAKRTDPHIIAKEEPKTPLSAGKQWVLAVGASYTQRDGLSHKYLGGHPFSPDTAREMLSKSWGIKNKAALLKEVQALRTSGHHTQYDLDGVRYLMMNNNDYQLLLARHPDKAIQIKATRTSFLTWRDRTGLAWDLCRASMIVNQGYAARYLNEKEAWDNLFSIAGEVQSNFSSWKEMADNFLDGRSIWDNEHSLKVAYCTQLLLDSNDPNSPWNQLPWKTDLTAN
jgi:serine/threonine-protein phosphatase 6 regulatory ankyrin repeat subunit B